MIKCKICKADPVIKEENNKYYIECTVCGIVQHERYNSKAVAEKEWQSDMDYLGLGEMLLLGCRIGSND